MLNTGAGTARSWGWKRSYTSSAPCLPPPLLHPAVHAHPLRLLCMLSMHAPACRADRFPGPAQAASKLSHLRPGHTLGEQPICMFITVGPMSPAP